MGGKDYYAPGCRVGDFLANRTSRPFKEILPSYKPGVRPVNLAESLPSWAILAIREALPAFDKQISGFSAEDAVLTAVETRTSSPLRITRNPDTLESINTKGLYPAGEGAGYAGGILSAAIDGIKAAEALSAQISGRSPAIRGFDSKVILDRVYP
jgi:uncharacterized FAD-dependent dehydrogenase